MAYNEKLADRVREIIAITENQVEDKKMFGGLCFMVNEKMCIGVQADSLMIRHHPDLYESLLEKNGCSQMLFTGKEMKGYVYVSEDVLQTDKQLNYWVQIALDFNKIAKASKKKKK